MDHATLSQFRSLAHLNPLPCPSDIPQLPVSETPLNRVIEIDNSLLPIVALEIEMQNPEASPRSYSDISTDEDYGEGDISLSDKSVENHCFRSRTLNFAL